MKNEKAFYVLTIVTILFTIIGGSLAYLRWQTTSGQSTSVTFTVGSTFSCSADGGGSITANNYFAPTDCDNSTYAIKREITVNTTSQVASEIINLSMDLNITNISPALLQSDYFLYSLTQDANSCSGAIQGGSFKDNYDSESHTVPLLIDEEFIGSESKTYYLYIWLDKEETNSNTMNTSFSASLEGTCTDSGNILNKKYMNLGNSSAYFKNTTYRGNITSVSFVNEINIPDNATNWNVGVSPSSAGDVKAWLEDDESGNNTFTLKIGANGTIFANDLSYAFYNMRNVNSFDFSNLNTSMTTNMANMFTYVAYNVPETNLSFGNNFDTSNVINMSDMLSHIGTNSINFNIDLGNKFNTSNVTDMIRMFEATAVHTNEFSLNLGNHFNTANVIVMGRMFYGTAEYSNSFYLNLGNNFNTINVTSTSMMFFNAGYNSTYFSLDLGPNFNTSNVENMQYMFYETGIRASSFYLNLGNQFNTSNVINMASMFYYTGHNTQNKFSLDMSSGNFAAVTNNVNMFRGFPASKATIYVKDATAQQWIMDGNSAWGTNFNASNVLIK